jgi:hypothetical protein
LSAGAHRDKKKNAHTHKLHPKTQENTWQVMRENQHFHSSTVLYKQPRETNTLTEAMKARQKRRVAGPTTGFCSNQDTCVEEK